MRRKIVNALCASLGAVVAALVLAGAAGATPRPSERACLLAWNAPGNAAERRRAIASGRWSRASLRPGTSGTFSWQQGSDPKETTAEACLLTLVKPARFQLVTGLWRGGRVIRWSFGSATASGNAPAGSNVRLLGDGRVTKIYRR